MPAVRKSHFSLSVKPRTPPLAAAWAWSPASSRRVGLARSLVSYFSLSNVSFETKYYVLRHSLAVLSDLRLMSIFEVKRMGNAASSKSPKKSSSTVNRPDEGFKVFIERVGRNLLDHRRRLGLSQQ